jgi:3-deoxy-D-manno-octulosonate 8-phosphate phosphatase (KDO 8-P phosphatase)
MMTINCLLLDVDGVLTDGRLWYGENGEALKCFHVRDGHGLKELIKHGVQVGIISGRDCPALRKRLQDLGITLAYLGVSDKLPVYQQIKQDLGLTDDTIAYMGDDLPDVPVMQQAGLAITVPNAAAAVAAVADKTTTQAGGYGAVREVCDYLLQQWTE